MKESIDEMNFQIMNKRIKSKISHSAESDRVYIMHLHEDDFPEIIGHVENLSDKFNYTKIVAKVPSKFAPSFLNSGYIIEAFIPNFFKGTNDVLFMSKYKDNVRKTEESNLIESFQRIFQTGPSVDKENVASNYIIRELTVEDIDDMIAVFKKVFATYPFPIFESSFLKKSIQGKESRYFGAFCGQKLIAVSSAECDYTEKNAEMTDFAILPEHRKKGLSVGLLSFMEEELVKNRFTTFYTISRLRSLPMNKAFYNKNYEYTGTLIKNTQIAGNIESMNVWYKNIN
jgi:putative beta-lysine N-acetyltransferase